MAQQYTRVRVRLRYRFDNLVARGTTVLISWLALACLAFVVPMSLVLVWADRRVAPTASSRLTAVWVSVGQTLKIGGAVGSPVFILASVSLALVALLFVSTLVSLITTGIDRRIMALRLGHSTVLETRHTVVLGWSDQIFPVVGELVAANANQRRSAIAVLAPKDKVEMEEEISTHIPATGTTRIICRHGSTTDPAVLARVSPETAKAVLVLPPGGEGGDAHVVKTLLALNAAVPEAGSAAVVVAAVRDTRNHVTARLAAGPGGHVLCVDDIVARLLVQTARQPGLSLVYQELLDFEGDEFYTAAAEGLVGRTFGEVLLSFTTSSVVGLLRADGSVALNPAPDTELCVRDRVVVISRDDGTAVPEDAAGFVDADAIVTTRPRTPLPERLLLLGWNRRAPLIVEQLDQYVSPGTTLDVVALGGDSAVPGSGLAPARGHLDVSFQRGDITDPGVLAKLDVPSYDNVIVIGEMGHASVPAPRPVPSSAAGTGTDAGGGPATGSGTAAGPPRPESETGAEMDDRTLVTLLHLRAIGDAAHRELSITTEMSDDGNRLLAPAREGADFIVSGRMISLLMTQISESRYLADVFEELFAAEGNELYLKPASDYVRVDREVAFATVVESALRRRECAVGYRLRADTGADPAHGVRLNPDKRERIRFTGADWVIVLAES
ncbi:NAD-binding lipoprotein [Streptomyces sp. NPDC058701]|uniref:CASTOR/POLLUX-related putative ion channel n=1 Tax=Streptomyces sp. NPDC058701 TaxID=3346608 RepID=UPI003650F641